MSTMLVPGAGEPNFDSRVADPFQAKRARREQEVHQLLDKLQPDMIVLDPTSIGQVPLCSHLLCRQLQAVTGMPYNQGWLTPQSCALCGAFH